MSYLSESINMRSLMRDCLECVQEFIPNESGEECCSDKCAAVYYGWDTGCDTVDWTDDYNVNYDLDYTWGDEAEYYGTNWN